MRDILLCRGATVNGNAVGIQKGSRTINGPFPFLFGTVTVPKPWGSHLWRRGKAPD